MPDTVEGDSSNLDTPRSPVSISTESSGHGSLKPVHPEKGFEPPTPDSPDSPDTHLIRKRAASLNTESANHPRIGDLALSSASLSGASTSDLTREQVCLCQPDPKIPRPRNAFILYRQHYQAQVVAQHPGLANPEISKIIGERWREQASEVKSEWKRLAEEEKQRHQRQYPGYRYQPRRGGKSNGARPVSASSTDDLGRCPKCNGRYITTLGTPLTPFTPASEASSTNTQSERLLPPFTPLSSVRPPQVEPRLPSQMQNVRLETPRSAPAHQQTHRRAPYSQPQPQPLHTFRERDEDMDMLSPSPDLKRRRFATEPQRGYPSLSSPVSYANAQSFPRNAVPLSATGYRQQHLPGPTMLVRQGNMGPPPSKSPMIHHGLHPYSSRSNTFDESLRLPPLQTQLPTVTPTSAHRPDLRVDSRDSQARGVEAMVMTIPYVNKIKVLTRISPPLVPSGPTSPVRDIRGAVIAVESADRGLLGEVGIFVNEHLGKDNTCTIKTWTTSRSPSNHPPSPPRDTEMADASSSPSKSSAHSRTDHVDLDPFVEYLSIISEWHKKSQEIVKYITTIPNFAPVDQTSSQPRTIPIALLPHGFSLTTSDTFALRIPINDSYAPVDHWQWMATLWRGIVGPDLTIYAKRVDKDEMDRHGGVEIRDDCSGIIVRVTDGGKMDEKTARRLGFEVMEFVRGIEGSFTRH